MSHVTRALAAAMLGSLTVLSAQFSFTPTRTSTPPQLDGQLDDPVWQQATPLEGYTTLEPTIGDPVSERTVAYAAYDSDYLYFAVYAYDSEPALIKSNVANWDQLLANQQDFVGVIMDALHDRQGAAVFIVNASGSQADVILAGPESQPDPTPDYIWQAAGSMVADGYVVEMRIPLQSLRYNAGAEVKMGLGFVRTISRRSEISVWPEILPERGNLVTQLAEVTFQNLGFKRTVEILPSLTQGVSWADDGGQLAKTDPVYRSKLGMLEKAGLGATAKVSLTPTLTLDMTINPDFSQVESDEGQVDVNQRTPLFFSEKRPFFLEGLDNLSIGGESTGALRKVVHTRQMIDPAVGIKVNGKLGAKNAITLLSVADESPLYNVDDTAGKMALFNVARYKRLGKADNYVGGVITSRDYNGSYNRVAGVDGLYRITNALFLVTNGLLTSSYDAASKTSTNSHNADASFNYSDQKWYVGLGFHSVGKDFDLDAGSYRRDGLNSVGYGFSRSWFPATPLINRFNVTFFGQQREDSYADKREGNNGISAGFNANRSTNVNFNSWLGSEIFEDTLWEANGLNVNFNSQVFKSLSISTGFGGGSTPWLDSDDPRQAEYSSQRFSFTYQPTDKITLAVNTQRSEFFSVPLAGEAKEELYSVSIYRLRTVYQLNRYLLVRYIGEYTNSVDENDDRQNDLHSDFLISFTYSPGTVLHLGYGSFYEAEDAATADLLAGTGRYLEQSRALFLKGSYNWRK